MSDIHIHMFTKVTYTCAVGRRRYRLLDHGRDWHALCPWPRARRHPRLTPGVDDVKGLGLGLGFRFMVYVEGLVLGFVVYGFGFRVYVEA